MIDIKMTIMKQILKVKTFVEQTTISISEIVIDRYC